MNNETIPEDFYSLLPVFVNRYCGRIRKFDQQRLYDPSPKHPNGFFMYYNIKRPPVNSDWIDHFYLAPRRVGNYTVGSLSMNSLGEDGIIKWISIDIDNDAQMKVWALKLRPLLDSLNIEYFIEWSGDCDEYDSYNRCHVMVFFDDVEIQLAEDFVRQLFYSIQEPIFADELCHFPDKKEILFDEIFSINKKNNQIRPPGGHHIKPGRNRRYPCEFNDQRLDNPVDIMYAIVNIKLVNEQFIRHYLDPTIISKLNDKVTFTKKLEKLGSKRIFYGKLINLPDPFEGITPEKLKPVVRNCQAINTLLNEVKNGLINKRGSTYHEAQLFLRGTTKYIDTLYKINKGEEFYNYLRENYRFRSDEDHQLDRMAHGDNAIRYFPSCKKWHEKFGLCDGCSFVNKVGNPVRFIKAQAIQSYKISRANVVTQDYIRTEEFPRIRKRIIEYVERGMEKFIVLGHPCGSGKSVLSRDIIKELVSKNRRVLISVYSTELAKEYSNDLAALGINSFILGSHKGNFNPEKPEARLSEDDCSFYEEIQRLESLGVSSSEYKKQYCQNCPLYQECRYPRQYKEVLDDVHDVVIIQHAHFGCEEVMYDLLSKNFDIMFIDETFIDSLYKFIPVREEDIEILEKSPYSWCRELANWLSERSDANSIINASDLELEIVKNTFTINFRKWIVPDLIRFYNQGRDVIDGYIEAIYRLPRVPVIVSTDATVPVELLKHLTGIDDIEVHGTNLTIDNKSIHPDNEIIQVLDFTSSVTWLQEEETFNIILDKIAKDVSSMSTNSKVLITAYLKDHRRIEKYLGSNHTTLAPKLSVSSITKGLNKYSDYDVQYLLANIIFLPKDYADLAYKYVKVANYHRKRRGLDPIPVFKPESITDVHTTFENTTRIEGNFIVEYSQFKIRKPTKTKNINHPNYWFRLIYEKNLGDIRQAIRVRLTDSKARKIVVLNNVPLPNCQIDQSIDLNSWLNQ